MGRKDAAVCDCGLIHGDTVDAVAAVMPPRGEFAELKNLYKMFADGTRLKILWALSCADLCVCDLAALLNMTKSAVSHQLKALRLVNLVRNRRDGKVVFYSLADEHVKDIFEKGFEHINEDK